MVPSLPCFSPGRKSCVKCTKGLLDGIFRNEPHHGRVRRAGIPPEKGGKPFQSIPCLFRPEKEIFGGRSFVEQAGKPLPELLEAFLDFRGKLLGRKGGKEFFGVVDALFRKGCPSVPAEGFQEAQRLSPKQAKHVQPDRLAC